MPDLLFETSWEVCNKVGGIYAVLSTKAKTLQSLYKDKVIFIGPDVWSPSNESPDLTNVDHYWMIGASQCKCLMALRCVLADGMCQDGHWLFW